MNWEERIKQSDAGKLMPERAEEIVAEAKRECSLDKVSPKVLRSDFSWCT